MYCLEIAWACSTALLINIPLLTICKINLCTVLLVVTNNTDQQMFPWTLQLLRSFVLVINTGTAFLQIGSLFLTFNRYYSVWDSFVHLQQRWLVSKYSFWLALSCVSYPKSYTSSQNQNTIKLPLAFYHLQMTAVTGLGSDKHVQNKCVLIIAILISAIT